MADTNGSRARRQTRQAETWGDYGWAQPAPRGRRAAQPWAAQPGVAQPGAAHPGAAQRRIPDPRAPTRTATGYPPTRSAAGYVPPGGSPRSQPRTAARRTVTIRGRGDERAIPPASRSRPPVSRSRPPVRRRRSHSFRPDRVALWAVMLGVLLVLVAAASAHAAATIHRHAAGAPAAGQTALGCPSPGASVPLRP
jgi:hypothetical protein